VADLPSEMVRCRWMTLAKQKAAHRVDGLGRARGQARLGANYDPRVGDDWCPVHRDKV
jgi:hypothetical protein